MLLAQEIDLNVIPKGLHPSIVVSQFDDQKNALIVYLYKDNVTWTPPNGSGAIINGIKPDHHGFSYTSNSITGNKVIFNITKQMTAVAGIVICEVRISKGTEIVGTLNFDIIVEPAPLRDNNVVSNSYLPLVENAVAVAANISQYITTATTAAEAAEAAAERAEDAATDAAQTAAQDVRDTLSVDINRALNAAIRAENAESASAVYNQNIINNYQALETAKTNANTAASNAQTIADTLTTAYNNNAFKGNKGDKGDTGESGISVVSVGLFTLSVDSDGNLYAWTNDQYDSSLTDGFYYDSDTGNLYYDFEYTDPNENQNNSEP